MRSSLKVILLSSGASPGALGLLDGYSDGFAFLANRQGGLGEVAVKDTTTPANNKSNVAAHELITQSGTSPKLVRQSDGTYAWSPHNLQPVSEDWTDSAWLKTNGATVSGQEITDPNASGYAQIQDEITSIVGATYTTRFRVLKDAVTDRVAEFQTAQEGAIVQLNTSTGGTHERVTTRLVSQSVTDGGSEWVLDIVWTASTTNDIINILPAAGASLGSVSNSVTGSVTVNSVHTVRGTSVGSYIETTGSAVIRPAFEYDPDFGGWRMLVEPAATNLLTYSHDYSQYTGTTGLTTGATNIDGTTTATTFTATSGTGVARRKYLAITLAADTTVFHTVRVKPGTHDYVTLGYRTGSQEYGAAVFDLSNTAATTYSEVDVGSTSGTVSAPASTQEYDSDTGWFTLTLAVQTAGTNGLLFVGFAEAATGNTFDAFGQIEANWAGTETFIAGYSQAEIGGPSSPIPTYGATVTRAADNLTVAQASLSWLEDAERDFSVVVQYEQREFVRAQTLISFNPSSNDLLNVLRNDAGDTEVHTYVRDDNNDVSSMTTTNGVAVDTTLRAAMAHAANDTALSANGGAEVSATTAGGVETDSDMYVGQNPSNNLVLLGYIDEIVFVPQRLSDAKLQELSS